MEKIDAWKLIENSEFEEMVNKLVDENEINIYITKENDITLNKNENRFICNIKWEEDLLLELIEEGLSDGIYEYYELEDGSLLNDYPESKQIKILSKIRSEKKYFIDDFLKSQFDNNLGLNGEELHEYCKVY